MTLPNQPYRPASLPVSESRRKRVTTINEAAGGQFSVSGFQQVTGPGEATFNVAFPVQFFEMPVVGFGSHIGPATGSIPNALNGSFPTVSSMVATWHTQTDAVNAGTPYSRTGALYYVGASIITVVTGQLGQVITVHYQFTGKAMSFLPTGKNVA